MLTEFEERIAKALYKSWFEEHPDISNPTDMNSEVKYDHAMRLGWKKYSLMQRARKNNLRRDGYPYPWTKKEYWDA